MVGTTVLHYRVVERIGGGGMGVVWKAVDLRLNREVALKFLHESATSDPSLRERFFREARAASALNHPNIITIYEINSDGDRLFMAMELVRGRALSEILRERYRLPPRIAADYALQICEGVGAAHRAGIVHRDLKPSNLMVTAEERVKILDFGLAKLRDPDSGLPESAEALAAPLTLGHAVVGTVPYMSPEQAAGHEVGPRSDVFSLGVVLYEMLSGRRPFQGASNVEIMRALLASEPKPLGSVTLDVPEPLAQITHRCLEKNPEARYADAGEAAAQLRALDLPYAPAAFAATTSTTAAQASLPWLTGRRILAAAAALLLAAALTRGLLQWRSRNADDRGPPAAGTLAPAEALQRAQAYLQRYDRKGNADRAIATLEPALQRDPSSAALRAALAEGYVRKFGEVPDKQWLQRALDSGRQAASANEDLAAAHIAWGMALAAAGQDAAAARRFERARDLNPLSGPAHLGLARLRSGREAEQLYQAAVRCSPGDWDPLNALATFYYRDARYDDAVAAWRQALQLTPDNVLVLVYLGAGLHMKGQYGEADEVLQHALGLDAANATTWANLGTARYFQGQFQDAVRAAEKAVDLAPDRYLYWGNLGDAYRWTPGLGNRAAGAYEKSIRLARERLAVAPNDRIRSSLAVYLAKSGDAAGALAELARLEPARQSDKGTLFKSALVYELARDRRRALAALEGAIRGGYSMHEITHEPELSALRSDPRYARIASQAAAGGNH